MIARTSVVIISAMPSISPDPDSAWLDFTRGPPGSLAGPRSDGDAFTPRLLGPMRQSSGSKVAGRAPVVPAIQVESNMLPKEKRLSKPRFKMRQRASVPSRVIRA